METMREGWTDERLDHLNQRIDERFDRIEAELAMLRSEMSRGFSEVHARFDSLQRTMIQFSGVMVAALIGVVATQL